MATDGFASVKEAAPVFDGKQAMGMLSRLKPLLAIATLSIVEFVAIGPSVQYITLTFFAQGHGGGDCEATPSSPPCRAAASDAALYAGVSNGICSTAGAFLALGLGAYSDHVGRRPLIRIRSWLSLLPIVSLALHVFAGSTLWIFLVASPAFRAFDITGVMLAFISDTIVDPQERAAAMGVFTTSCIGVVVLVLPLAGLLPACVNVAISLLATFGKITFLYLAFPETLRVRSTAPHRASILRTPAAALTVFARHHVILRMALVLVLSSLSSAGLNTIAPPYLTAFMGLTRAQGSALLLATICSAVLGMGLGVGPLVRVAGEVGALQVCLAVTVMFPVLITGCQTVAQVGILSAALAAPLAMLMPIISSIKANLVAEDEQGLVQGAITCVCNFAMAASDVFFGFFYRHVTDGGTSAERSSVYPLFFASAAFGLSSWLLALSLPSTLPPPPRLEGSSKAEPLLQAEAA